MTTYTRRTLPSELARYQEWPEVDLSTLDGAVRSRVGEIRAAITAYLDGQRMKERLAQINLSHPEMLRRLNRCISFDREGRLVGWPALLPDKRLKPYIREKPATARESLSHGGYSGALGQVLSTYPALVGRLSTYIITGSKDGAIPESRVTAAGAHGYFTVLCRHYGIKYDEWPFCVEGQGDRAFRRWFNKFVSDNYDLVVRRQYGKDAATKAATGGGVRSRLQARLPFDIVEMDEHTLDVLGCIGVPTPKGLSYVLVKRLVVILVVDRFSQAVLGYRVIVRRKVKASDIVTTIARAITQWRPRRMSLDGFTAPADGGFPSEKIDELSSCGFGMLLIDNDSAHLAEAALSQIGFMAGCAINYGPVRRPERRPIVESINKRLEANGFQRLPSTTGSGPEDTLRDNAEAKALKYRIHLDALLDLVEAVIADHNASRPNGNFGRTPLQLLRQYVDDEDLGFLPPVLPPLMPGMPALGRTIESLPVGGSRSRGDRAHIMFDRVRYEAPWLASRPDLIRRTVVAHVDEDEISSFQVFTQDGAYLGVVRTSGAWAGAPHSRETRKLINAAIKKGHLEVRTGHSVVSDFLTLLAKEAVAKGGTGKHPVASKEGNQLAEEIALGHLDAVAAGGDARQQESEGEVTDSATKGSPLTTEPARPRHTVSSFAEAHTLLPTDVFFAIN